MDVSIVDLNHLGKAKTVDLPIEHVILKENWCPSIFHKNNRLNSAFKSTDLLVFDIDQDLTVAEAQDIVYDNYECIIALSRNHQKKKKTKGGIIKPACDRFRVILYLDAPITDEAIYRATWTQWKSELFSMADPACCDPARFYYPCTEIYTESGGKQIYAVDPPPIKEKPVAPLVPQGERGQLSRATLDFLTEASPDRPWHGPFVKACFDLREQGYTEDETIDKLTLAATSYGTGSLDSKDLKHIEDIYTKRETKYDFRPKAESDTIVRATELIDHMFEYLDDDKLVQGEPTGFPHFDTLLGGGFKKGELTCIGAEPKAGKTTFANQLIYNYLTKGIACGYASREVRPAQEIMPHLISLVLKQNMFEQKITDRLKESALNAISSWPLYFAEGYGVFPIEKVKEWMTTLHMLGVDYFFIDQFQNMLYDSTDLKEITQLIQLIKQMVNELNVHVFLILQVNKSDPNAQVYFGPHSIKGGSVMLHTLDNLLLLERRLNADNVSKLIVSRVRHRLAKRGNVNVIYDPKTLLMEEAVKDKRDDDRPYQTGTTTKKYQQYRRH